VARRSQTETPKAENDDEIPEPHSDTDADAGKRPGSLVPGARLEPVRYVERELTRPDGSKLRVKVPVYPPFRLEERPGPKAVPDSPKAVPDSRERAPARRKAS
jgi:uncharacterized protein (DUF58 family)